MAKHTIIDNKKLVEPNRFQFGENWISFLKTLSNERIQVAESSLKDMLGISTLEGQTFLDVGCGSGLFSLAATNLGAKVHSFDYDISSVNATRFLKEKFHPTKDWKIEQGSILDKPYLDTLFKFDIVYAWGVLHHTGDLLQAMENVVNLVNDQGKLFIAIYNDEGIKSKRWLRVKELYNANFLSKAIVIGFYFPYFLFRGLISDLVRLKNPIQKYMINQKERGMSIFHDWYDWLGGLPYEVAKPELIFDFYKKRGLLLEKIITCNGHGNNEFIFIKTK